jgi:L-lysine exporter family protein LysE/ArgO
VLKLCLEGMILQASLIFALGPQNLYVLESGLRREHHVSVGVVCFLCDLALIMFGVVGAASFFNQYPGIKIFVGLLGVVFLFLFGLDKLKSKGNYDAVFPCSNKKTCLKAAILSSVVFSLVNPHAYLDGIVLIGGHSAKYSLLSERLVFGAGAAFFSLLWFLILSTGASFMVALFQNKQKIKTFMWSTGILLLLMSVKLSFEVCVWISELYPRLFLHFGGFASS